MNTDKKLLAVLRKQNKVMDMSVIIEKMDTIIEKLDDIASALAAPDVDPEPEHSNDADPNAQVNPGESATNNESEVGGGDDPEGADTPETPAEQGEN